jgi:hypothetical protein
VRFASAGRTVSILELRGPWKARTVPAWNSQWLATTDDALLRQTLNASVTSDGTIRLT